jgi:hypothetical protein
MKNVIFGLLLSILFFLPLAGGCSSQIPLSTTPITESTSITVPPVHLDLKFQGDLPGGNDAARQEFDRVYPYLVDYLGEPFSIGQVGVTWIWDPSITTSGQIGWNTQDNTVIAGPKQGILDPPPFPELTRYWNLYQQYEHETCHLFYNTGDSPIEFTFGQWIWEAHALVGQAFAYAQVYRDGLIGANVSTYDNIANIGWDQLNGVRVDGDKYNRTIVDSSATTALRLMTEVFAGSSGKEDFVRRVNTAILAEYKSFGDLKITADKYKTILNNVSGEQTIDGMLAGDWLFAQPVANLSGALGTYLIIYPNYSNVWRAPNEFDLAYFNRVNGQNPGDLHENGLVDQEITVTVLDSTSKLIKQTTVRTQGDGTARIGRELNTDELPQGVYIIQAKTVYNGKEITASNFFIVLSQENQVTANDNRMFIVPLNADGNALRTELGSKLQIDGGQVKSSLPGILIITAEPGKEVTITYGTYKRVVSKPLTARIVPLRVPY